MLALAFAPLRTALITCFGLCAALIHAQPTDLIISEYVEGSSNIKYLELYNGTGAAIDLSDYEIRNYSNGNTTPTTTNALSGMLANGATIVYKNSSATIYGGAATNATAVAFNGDDAMVLWKVSTGLAVDIFGNIGCDPGNEWTSGSTGTEDQTLVRNANICAGVTTDPGNTGCPFPTLSSEWTQYAQNDVSHLGSHTMTCGPTVNFNAAAGSAMENTGTNTVNLTINPATVAAGTISFVIGGTGTATYGTDYTSSPAAVAGVFTVNVASGATTASFDLNLVDEGFTEPNETVNISISGTTGGISIGGASSHVFTITNDDNTPTISFSTTSISVLENAGVQTVTLGLLPTTHPSGSVTITVANGPGAVYGSDYTTNPAGGGGTFTIPVGVNAPTVSFQATVIDDALLESTETITFTITGTTGGLLIGSNNAATLMIGDNDSPATALVPGDLVVVGVNANDNACDGGDPENYDYVSFFCFKEITFGTELILTDNGYERCIAGQWGNQEGTLLMTRTGPAIPAGQVITFRIKAAPGPTNVASVAPDAGWTCTNIGIGGTSMAFNAGGEQLFFMQGGTWNPGTSGSSNATYTGTVLYAFSTNPSPPWTAHCTTNANQRSNLPPGVECFSMAPTSATDFSKYTGPITAATQRDWIIRIDNTANWSSYPSCTQYYANGPNWLSAPTLPITPGAMTAGLWRGSTNTDWFECKNWDDAQVPVATTDVEINSSAIRVCDVGLNPGVNPGGTAVCASVWHHFSSSAPYGLNVRDNSTLNVGGEYRIENTHASALTVQVMTNATLTADSVWIGGTALGSTNATLKADYAGSLVDINGDLRIAPGGTLDLSSTAGNSGTLELGGDFINQEDEAHFHDNYSTVLLDGIGNQTVQHANPAEYFYDLDVNKPGGGVNLTAPITIRHDLDLTQGIVYDTLAGALVTVLAGATASNASNASFVHGPVQKIGDTDFTFPIGDADIHRAAQLESITGGASVAFTARYRRENPELTIGPLVQPTGLDHISHCDHWSINRSAGLPNARVVLSWNTPDSCVVTAGALGDLRVARWNGSNWDDHGNGGTTGSAAAGTVSSANIETAFSPWTLASVTANNPLPIELLSFTATPGDRLVELRWSTASEQDNAWFTVERSPDAIHYDPILHVPGAGNSQQVLEYGDRDPEPLSGLSYYRLRQTDQNGTSTVSGAVPVYFHGHGREALAVLQGAEGTFVLHGFATGSTLEVLDLTGRVVARSTVVSEGLAPVPTERLPHGVYVLRINDAVRTESARFAH